MPESDGDISTIADLVIDLQEKAVTLPLKMHPLHGAGVAPKNSDVNKLNNCKGHDNNALVPSVFADVHTEARV